eukprot:gb/GECG01015562.1/.p1 GENE.gb/GECG01015562.1/~~gb/GECG01015562.1/.p1  ORF type:complete len:551 (+),score=47.97 gb/GECG01015562.1/:1-1653(+)
MTEQDSLDALRACFRHFLQEAARYDADEGLVFSMRRRRHVVSCLIFAYNQLSTWLSRKVFFLALAEDLWYPGQKTMELVLAKENKLSLEELQRASLTNHEVFLREAGSLPGGVEWTIDARGHLRYLLRFKNSSPTGDTHYKDLIDNDLYACRQLEENILRSGHYFLASQLHFPKGSDFSKVQNPPRIGHGNAIVSNEEEDALSRLDRSIKYLFGTQIAVFMKRIGFWKNLVERQHTIPCTNNLMQFIWRKEAVHPIQNSSDLKRRIGLIDNNRRCYGLFHPTMPEVPLIFVEVLIAPRLCASVDEVLPLREEISKELTSDGSGKTAIFYSITNPHPGLQGLQLASLLLYLVMDKINHEEAISSFATLSPMPQFAKWLHEKVERRGLSSLMGNAERRHLANALGVKEGRELDSQIIRELKAGTWRNEAAKNRAVTPLLERWAARYILFERRQTARGNRIIDPVGNFHGQNGATLERIRVHAFDTPRVSHIVIPAVLGCSNNSVFHCRDYLNHLESWSIIDIIWSLLGKLRVRISKILLLPPPTLLGPLQSR